jgi:hypothetical protein
VKERCPLGFLYSLMWFFVLEHRWRAPPAWDLSTLRA